MAALIQDIRRGGRMANKIGFLLYEKQNVYRQIYNYRMNQVYNTFLGKPYIPRKKKFCGKKVLDQKEANQCIGRLILGARPFWVARLGHTELRLINAIQRMRILKKDDTLHEACNALCNNAGFFPNRIEYIERYVDLMLDCIHDVDVHAYWPLDMENYYFRRYENCTDVMWYGYLEPWGMTEISENVYPWSHYLKGKKVLIIHPFSKTIEKQYETQRVRIFSRLFSNVDDILPEFELKTLKAVQTIAGTKDNRFHDWFEALRWMNDECEKIDFDLAILGCGAYGYPLACQIKRMGKGAIQLCGATQLMFGIMGKRWEKNKFFAEQVFNSSWVYPDKSEQITNVEKVEMGETYW